jgi:hypothetical protein
MSGLMLVGVRSRAAISNRFATKPGVVQSSRIGVGTKGGALARGRTTSEKGVMSTSTSSTKTNEPAPSCTDRGEVGSLRRGGGWLWIPVGVVLGLFKAHVLVGVIGHRGGAITLLAMWLAIALLRMRLASVALTAAALLGILGSSHSLERGLELGLAAFVVLMGAFFAISTYLLARQHAA